MKKRTIFLCHAKEDEAEALKVYEQLNALGFAPWMDCRDLLPGQDWEKEIPRVIHNSDFMLIFLSQTSVQKRGYVQREFKLAEETRQLMPEGAIFDIPVLLSACEVPSRFKSKHWAKLYESGGFNQLLKSLEFVQDTTKVESNDIKSKINQARTLIAEIEIELFKLPPEHETTLSVIKDPKRAGVIKLLPRGLYSQSILLAGGGAYYSFARLTHAYGQGSDIELQGKSLLVGFAGLDYGFFLPLAKCRSDDLFQIEAGFPAWCDKSIEEAWTFAWNYQAPQLRTELRQQFRDFRSGVQVGPVTLSSRVDVEVGKSWLLRSFGFRGRQGIDVIVAVNAVSLLEDGSLILAWKILRQQPTHEPSGPDEIR